LTNKRALGRDSDLTDLERNSNAAKPEKFRNKLTSDSSSHTQNLNRLALLRVIGYLRN